MDSRHSPRMLRGSWTMSRSPRRHSAIVDLLKSLLGNARGFRNLGKCLDSWILGVETRGIRRAACLDSLVGCEACIRPGILPTHLGSTSGVLLAFDVLARGQSTMIFQRPIHPYSFPPMDFW